MSANIIAAGGGPIEAAPGSSIKLCKKCNVEKPLNDMVKKEGSYRHECKECRNARARARLKEDPEFQEKERLRGKEKYQKNKEKHLAITKRYYEENLEWRKDLHLRTTYGITMDQKIQMRDAQGNKCAICAIEFLTDKDAYVDHCHESKKVRGLLCHCCNTGLGMFKDSMSALERAMDYLKKNSTPTPN